MVMQTQKQDANAAGGIVASLMAFLRTRGAKPEL